MLEAVGKAHLEDVLGRGGTIGSGVGNVGFPPKSYGGGIGG